MTLMPKIGVLQSVETSPAHTQSVEASAIHVMSIRSGDGVPYDGAYEVEPGEEALILATKGKVLSQDIVIDPIPDGYGRISYSGSILKIW